MKRITMSLVVLALSLSSGQSQTYSSDLNDIARYDNSVGAITPIGDIGFLDKIIDLRGFIPFAFVSKAESKAGMQLKYLYTFRDNCRVFKIPTKLGVMMIYYGIDEDYFRTLSTAKPLDDVKLLEENQLSGDDLKWANFAYALTKSSGENLFKAAGGGRYGFDSAEPIAILLTAQSSIIIINFKYSFMERYGTGQILCGYEFSRTLKEYKTFYLLHTTIAISKSTISAFNASLPFVMKILPLFFGGQ